MGLYFRKSIGSGPFRINFSKSGVSYSVGAKGARVNFSNRGTYVSLAKGGIYYRKKIGGNSFASNNNQEYYSSTSSDQNIESTNLESISDTDSEDFIKELTKKAATTSLIAPFGVMPLLISLVLLFVIFFSSSQTTTSLFDENQTIFWFLFSVIIILFTFLLPFLNKVDRKNKTLEIHYDFDNEMLEAHKKFVDTFSEILKCSKVWGGYKYINNKGLESSSKSEITNISLDKKPLESLLTNVSIPFIALNDCELYFFPERIIIKRGNKFDGVMYKNMGCEKVRKSSTEAFSSIPTDSEKGFSYWQYETKDGKKDLRYSSSNYLNVQCYYTSYTLFSDTGFSEEIIVSKANALDKFIQSIECFYPPEIKVEEEVIQANQPNTVKVSSPEPIKQAPVNPPIQTKSIPPINPQIKPPIMDKLQPYEALISQRKKCTLCQKFEMTNTSILEYETNQIGKWSDWQGSLNAKFLVVGQDWGTVEYWNYNKGTDSNNNRTNEILRQLFLTIGYEIGTVLNPKKTDDLFFTNTVLCLKKGEQKGMSSALPPDCFKNCATNFLSPLINIIKPKYIIALGSKAYESIMLLEGVKQKDIQPILKVCGQDPIKLKSGTYLFPVVHCGGLGLRNRKFELQIEDWKKINEVVATIENKQSVPTFKIDLGDKITLQDLPYSKSWVKVYEFSKTFPFQNLGYTITKAQELFSKLETSYWDNGEIPKDLSINDLRACLTFIFNNGKFTSTNPPTHKDSVIIEKIILRLNNLLFDLLWLDK